MSEWLPEEEPLWYWSPARALSVAVVLAYALLAYLYDSAGGAAEMMLSMVFPLFCIWFPEPLGDYVGLTSRGYIVKWGNGCWIGSKGPVAYVYSDREYVQFGFFHGSSLKDPKGLLEGKGEYVRHIKVRNRSAIDRRAFAALLRQAARGSAREK